MGTQTQPITAIITGSSSGIGLSVARAFLEKGANIILNGRDPEKLAAIETGLGAGGRLASVAGDIGDRATGVALVRSAVERFGRVDVLINNAGTFGVKPFVEVTEEELDGFLYGNADVDSFGGVALLRRVGEADEIAQAVLYLTQAEFITGHILPVDGGFTTGRA